MEIDLYAIGDPESPDTWSRIPYEISEYLADGGYLRETVDCDPHAGGLVSKLGLLPYIRIGADGVYAKKYLSDRYSNEVQKTALDAEARTSPPDAILSTATSASNSSTPTPSRHRRQSSVGSVSRRSATSTRDSRVSRSGNCGSASLRSTSSDVWTSTW